MNAKDISSRKFDRGFNGYKPDDVDDFLKDIADEFAKLQKDNRDLEKKLELLADKVREYREDEDALKEALLGAQKQGHAAIAKAKEKSKQILEETLVKAEQIITDAKYNAKKIAEEADDELKKANDDARLIREEAAGKLGAMEAEYKAAVELNKEVLLKTKTEVTRFRQKLIEDFTRVTGIIETLPEACENEFVSKTVAEYKEHKEQKESKKEKSKAAKPATDGENNTEVRPPVGQGAPAVNSDELFDEFASSSNIVGDNKNETDAQAPPFFNKGQKNEEREALEFGAHVRT